MSDPQNLTVTQIKSELTKAGVKLPTGSRSKAFWAELYRTAILGEHDITSSLTPGPQSNTTPLSSRTSSRIKDKKSTESKRDRDSITKQLPFDEEEKPKKRKKSKNIEEVEEELHLGESNWQSYPDMPGPDQKRMDEFITTQPTPKKTPTPSPTPTPPKQDTYKQKNLHGEITASKVVLPVDTVEEEAPRSVETTSTQLRLDTFPVPKPIPKRGHSMAPKSLLTLESVQGVYVTGNREKEDRIRDATKKQLEEEEARKRDSDRRKSTPIPQEKKDRRKSSIQIKPSRKSVVAREVTRNIEEEQQRTTYRIWFFLGIFIAFASLIGWRMIRPSEEMSGPLNGKHFCDTPEPTKSPMYFGDQCVECPANGYCQLGYLTLCDPPTVRSKDFPLCIEDTPFTKKVHAITKRIYDHVVSGGLYHCPEKNCQSFDLVEKTLTEMNITDGRNELSDAFKKFVETHSNDIGIKFVKEEGNVFIENVYPIATPWCKITRAIENLITNYPYHLVATALMLVFLWAVNAVATMRQQERVEYESLVSTAISMMKGNGKVSAPQVLDFLKSVGEFKNVDVDAQWDRIYAGITEDPRVIASKEGDLDIWEFAPTSGDISKQLF